MGKKQEKKTKMKRSIVPTLIIIIIFLLISIGIGVYFYLQALEKRVKTHKYTDYSINLVIDDELRTDLVVEPLYVKDTVYIPFNIVNEYIDEYLYWDETMNKIIYTKLNEDYNDETIVFNENENSYYKNSEEITFNTPIIFENNYPFISEDILNELYDIKIFYNNNTVDLNTYNADIGVVSGKMLNYLKYEPSKDSDFILKLEEGEEVYKYNISEVNDNYIKIKTKSGILGYIEVNKINNYMTFDVVEEVEDNEIKRREEPIVLLWDQVTTKQANSNANRRVTHEGLNVLSPTWFSFDEKKLDGTIISLADDDYVEFAHKNGYEVWALITDIPSGNVSNVGNIANQVITNTDERRFAIEQLMDLIEKHNLDGINLDFEYIRATDIDDYIQFTRELYIEMRKEGYILSVDTYVPMTWSMYYNRKALAESSDYIIVMAYDEHTNANEKIGPVASINFVDKGVLDTLNEVPKEKLIMGIPFYTRVWRTEYAEDEVKKSLRNYGMVTAVDFFIANNAVIRWDDETGYYYSEFTTVENGNNVYYQAWLETTETIEEKLEIYKKYDLEGVAMWKRGLEDSDVWEIINEKVKK